MNISRNIISDLLPLYLAGEASADTRALLEQYLKEHPDYAAEMRRHVEATSALLGPAAATPPPDHEKAALERTRRFTRHRTHLLGFAIGYTLMPLAFVFNDNRVSWIMLRDNPKQAAMFLIAALGCWLGYYVMGRRLRQG